MKSKKEAIFILTITIIAIPIMLLFATVYNNLLIYFGALVASFWAFRSMKYLTQPNEGNIEK